MRASDRSSSFATQTAPSPTAIDDGRPPTFEIEPTTSFDAVSMIATEFGATLAEPPPFPCPNAKTGIATAAARTPISAEPTYMRRRLRLSSTSSVFNGPNSLGSPSISS